MRRVHVDTTQLDLKHKFELSVVQPPTDYNADETKYYQLKQLEHPPQDAEVSNFSQNLIYCNPVGSDRPLS